MDLKRLSAAVPVLLICLLPIRALWGQSEQGKAWATFSGTSTLTGYWSNRQGFGQEIPSQYLTWQFRGQITLLGIPFSGSGLLSTMQHPAYQSMNYGTLALDGKALLRSRVVAPRLRFLKHFETLELGRARPDYSKLMLQGVMLQGCNIGVRFGGFHSAFAWGISQQPITGGAFWSPQYRQKMLYGRIGVGKPDQSGVYLSWLRYHDLPETYQGETHFYVQKPDTFIHLTDTFFLPGDTIPLIRNPGEGLIVGMGGALALFKKRVYLDGEINGCINTTNINSETIDIESFPDWISTVYQPRLTTSVSYAARISGKLNLGNTRISATLMRVAPGYRTAGVPYLRQDYEGIEVQISQNLFKRRLTIQPWCRVYRDNLSGLKMMTSQTGIYGMSLFYKPLKLPWIHVNFSPHRQKVAGLEVSQTSAADVITLTTGRHYPLFGKMNANSTMSFSGQWMETRTNDAVNRYVGQSFMLQQGLILKIPLTIQLSGGIYILLTSDISRISKQLSAGFTYHHKKRWQGGAGIRYHEGGSAEHRTGLYANFSANLGKAGRISLITEPNRYRDLMRPELEFDQYVVRGVWVARL